MPHILHHYVFSFKRVENFQNGAYNVLVLLAWNAVSLSVWCPTFRDEQYIDFHGSKVIEEVLVLQLMYTQNSGPRR